MSLITLLIVLIVLVIVWYVLNTYILPKAGEPLRTIIVVIFFIIVIILLLGLVGIGPGIRL